MGKTSTHQLARKLRIPAYRGIEAIFKAKLLGAVIDETKRQRLTHAELAKRSGLPRSAVTGILSGSLQKITLDRVLRLVQGAGLTAEVRVKRAA